MRRLILLLVLSIAACNGPGTSPPPTGTNPSTPTVASVTQSPIPPTTISATPSSPLPPTETPPSTPTFPDPNAYQWQPIVSGLQRPVDLQADGSGRLFVIEKAGRIRIIQDGQLLGTPFLDISKEVGSTGNEQGLLGLAFHPQYAQNGRFFVNYTDNNGDTVLARFQVSSDPNVTDPKSEVKLLGVDQPFPNHNGGVLTFGPDGDLYAGLGDGGSQGDPFGNAQNTGVLLGKILRLDVNSADPYAVPPDNPFGNEVWAYGLRNPWRISFDRGTGDLYIGDVGQNVWEEIDFLPAGSAGGSNFGWSFREGAHDYKGGGPAGLVEPVAEYSHPEGGCSVTGGYVYRGSMPAWNGIYLYGDYCTGMIWGLIHAGNGWQKQLLFDLDVNITSFGQDKAGELYLVSDNGGIYRLAPQ
ncbi:MAG TPA: PQQ-dependent sugar dehydrogenase [Anaerolineales bacterium]|nr:PQQ-dependent sugar dehydrogenase [Anaerolineales bacterium]